MCILILEDCGKSGKLPPIETIAYRLGDKSVTFSVTKGALLDLEKTGLIVTDGETFRVTNWTNKQYKSDSSAERTREWRKRKRDGHGDALDQIRSETDQIRSEGDPSNMKDDKGGGQSKPRPKRYNIEIFLKDEDRDNFRASCPGWDIHFLMPKFNDWVVQKSKEFPTYPGKAFVAWAVSFTKGKKP